VDAVPAAALPAGLESGIIHPPDSGPDDGCRADRFRVRPPMAVRPQGLSSRRGNPDNRVVDHTKETTMTQPAPIARW